MNYKEEKEKELGKERKWEAKPGEPVKRPWKSGQTWGLSGPSGAMHTRRGQALPTD